MTDVVATSQAVVAIAGSPNVGKTSIFNRLTGARQKVTNYPGVTVERTEARLALPSGHATLVDIPGTYSLSARSAEEQIAINSIGGLPPTQAPDVVVMVLDATQLTRNLYLLLQVMEIGTPTVVALNMVDQLAGIGRDVDVDALQSALGVPVVAVSGLHGTGLTELKQAIDRVVHDPAVGQPGWRWLPSDPALTTDIEAVGERVPESWRPRPTSRRNAAALWALLSLDEEDELDGVPSSLRDVVDERRRLAKEQGRDLEREIVQGRYGWIDANAPSFLKDAPQENRRVSERIDRILLHPGLGFVLFLLAMGTLFQSLFSWSSPAIDVVETVMGGLGGWVENTLPAGLFTDFIVNGLIAGVGSVLVFLPQILLLFFFIGLMEDTGYMARVSFLMDRIMRAAGLHGRAFVPMLSGFACAVPAVLATRTMERQRDRTLTMMVIPLMTCSARLPVYTLVIAALFPPSLVWGFVPVQGLLMVAMYVFSVGVALVAAAVMGRTLFKGPTVPLILELPPYRIPQWIGVVRLMWMRSAMFLREAGTVILVCTVVLWVLLSFPQNPNLDVDYDALRAQAQTEEQIGAIDSEESGAVFRESYGARIGRAMEPTIEPLGFDWKIGIGILGAFAAREVFVSTMGVVYGVGAEVDEESTTLREKIRSETRANGAPVYTPLVGLSLMIFFALACQCMSTLAAVYRETKTWTWPTFLFVYMTALAWICSFAVYQGGKLLGFS